MRHKRYPDRFDILLHVGGFTAVAAFTWVLFPLFVSGDPILRSVSASLFAGLAANLACSRWFGSLRFFDFGLEPSAKAAKQLGYGVLLGAASMTLLVAGAVGSGLASFAAAESGNVTWLAVALFAGAAGEELLFRGYAFQFLADSWPGITILGSGLVFGLMHVLLNQNIQGIGALNTALWGALLGYAYCRTRALWLPIGIHYGWNLAQVLLGASLSGTTIRAAGIQLVWSAGDLWSGGDYGPEGGLLTTVAAVTVFLVLRRVSCGE